jgi:hypothetical protein
MKPSKTIFAAALLLFFMSAHAQEFFNAWGSFHFKRRNKHQYWN